MTLDCFILAIFRLCQRLQSIRNQGLFLCVLDIEHPFNLSFFSLDSASSQLVFSLLISLRFASSMEAYLLRDSVDESLASENLVRAACLFLLALPFLFSDYIICESA
jgi:hypothetical protein